jgi:DHA1 family tetracycline resistance protein-like MFS transporter
MTPDSAEFPPAPAAPNSQRAAASIFIFITVLLDVLGLGVVIPVLPQLLKGFLGSYAQAAEWTGIFGSVFAAMQFLFSPLIGALSDRFGRRPVLLMSNCGLGVDYLFMAVAPTIGWLFIGRVISGITASSIATAYAYVADVTEPEKRARAFGWIGAAFGLGFIIGSGLGGLLSDPTRGLVLPGGFALHGGLRLPFWVAACLSLANFAYGFFVLPESLSKARRGAFELKRANPIASLGFLASHRELLTLSFVNFLIQSAHYSLQICFVLYGDYRFKWSQSTVGLILVAVGVFTSLVQGLLTGFLVKRLGERRALLIGLFFGAAGFIIYGVANTGVGFLIGVPVMSLWGLSSPAILSLMTRRVSHSEQGRLQGANTSVTSIAGIPAPLVFGWVMSVFLGPWRHVGIPGAPFLLSGGFLICALVLAYIATRPRHESAEHSA